MTKKTIGILGGMGADAVMLDCTDLSFVIFQKETIVPLANCTEIYANKTAQLSLNKENE